MSAETHFFLNLGLLPLVWLTSLWPKGRVWSQQGAGWESRGSGPGAAVVFVSGASAWHIGACSEPGSVLGAGDTPGLLDLAIYLMNQTINESTYRTPGERSTEHYNWLTCSRVMGVCFELVDQMRSLREVTLKLRS